MGIYKNFSLDLSLKKRGADHPPVQIVHGGLRSLVVEHFHKFLHISQVYKTDYYDEW